MNVQGSHVIFTLTVSIPLDLTNVCVKTDSMEMGCPASVNIIALILKDSSLLCLESRKFAFYLTIDF